MPFNIIICGAGLGGLGAAIALRRKGHNVTILEATPKIAEVGAGIQIPPNSSRILKSWGVYDELREYLVRPGNINIRRYENGEVIGLTPLHPFLDDTYGHSYHLIHRADYQNVLLKCALKEGVHVQLNSYVKSVDEIGPSVTLADDRVLKADIVVGADGIRSKTRESILGSEDLPPNPLLDSAFRATIPRETMLADPETAPLQTEINCNCWIGPKGHIMAYPIRNGEMYNVVLPHYENAPLDKWSKKGVLAEMKDQYRDFDPKILKVLDKVDDFLNWRLADLPPLPRWVSKSGKVVLIGDAAHAMLPYLAQGAAMATEDGASLAECISRATDTTMIPFVLQAYEDLRKARCEKVQSSARNTGSTWHLPDGPAQQKRDHQMTVEMLGTAKEDISNPLRWSDKTFQPWLFGHDTIHEAKRYLDKQLSASL